VKERSPCEGSLGRRDEIFASGCKVGCRFEAKQWCVRRSSAACNVPAPTALGLTAVEPIGRDHLDSLSGQELVEPVTIVTFVADDSRRSRFQNHESEELLDKMAFGGIGRGAARPRQPLGVKPDHSLDAFRFECNRSHRPTLGFGKSAIDETFVEAKPASIFHHSGQRLASRIQRHRPSPG
jgi:hypothetical protein